VARTQGTLVYSVYESGSYSLYTAETPEAARGPEPIAADPGVEPDLLPPSGREPAEVDRLTHRASEGLAHASGFTRKPYKPGLSLLDVSQSGVGVGAGTSGVALSGGTTLYFSDLLGDHNLTTLIQASNQGGSLINNVAGVVAYENRRSRWNWGLTGAQVPYLNQAFTTEEVVVNGEPLLIQREYRDWQIDRQIGMTLGYPFNRVSRLELSGGYRDVDFSGEVETSVFSEITGQQLLQQTDPLGSDSIPSLHLLSSAAAFVYDASVFGGTSPVRGSRYRLEVDPVAGSLHFVGALADARIYRMPVRPLTIAARVLHFGRYSRDAESPLLNQIFVGDGWLIHGYDSGSFTPFETQDFNQLLGSALPWGISRHACTARWARPAAFARHSSPGGRRLLRRWRGVDQLRQGVVPRRQPRSRHQLRRSVPPEPIGLRGRRAGLRPSQRPAAEGLVLAVQSAAGILS
jgi:hypothetical protein